MGEVKEEGEEVTESQQPQIELGRRRKYCSVRRVAERERSTTGQQTEVMTRSHERGELAQ